jgi:hypothetical protein
VKLQKGERWRCQNRACASEILILQPSQLESGSNPRCSCGSAMKKPYTPPKCKTYEVSAPVESLLKTMQSDS